MSEVLIFASEAESKSDELRSLRAWLLDEDEFRGRVAEVSSPPRAGSLGASLDAIQVIADAGCTALASSLIAWIRTRVGSITLTAKNGHSEIQIKAKNVSRLDSEQLRSLTASIASALTEVGESSPKTAVNKPKKHR